MKTQSKKVHRETIVVGKRPIRVESHRIRDQGPAFAATGLFSLDTSPERRGRYAIATKDARTIDGQTFGSATEMRFYQELRLRERAGEIEKGSIELQPSFVIEVNGIKIGRYTADFLYREAGRNRYVEIKSEATARAPDYRLRRKLVEAIYGIEITEIVR